MSGTLVASKDDGPLAWGAVPVQTSETIDPRAWGAVPVQKGVPEYTSTLNQIIDTPDRMAQPKTIAAASLFPNVQDRIPVYAKGMNIPAERFGLVDGKIVYRDVDGALVRVEPSVVGATGPMDAAKRATGWAADVAGQAIPFAAGTAASMLAAPAGPVASAAAGGAASFGADVLRQKLGNLVNGTDVPTDYLNAGGQGALGASGPIIGRGVAALVERAPARAALSGADREFFRNPANVTQMRELAGQGDREGVTLLRGDLTNRESLITADRQLRRNPNSSDAMRDTILRRDTQEVPAAAGRMVDRIAPVDSTDAAARRFQETAAQVIESPRQETNLAARPAFRAAQIEPDQWNAAIRRIIGNNEMQGLYRAAAIRAERDVTLRTPGAQTLPPVETLNGRNPPPFQAWQYMRQELDARTAAAREANDFNTARQLGSLSDMLDNAVRDVNPHYVRAQAISAPGQQISERMREGVMGQVADATPDAAPREVLARMFDPSRTSPTAIGEARQAFFNAQQGDAWQEGFAAYVQTVTQQAQKAIQQGGEPTNVAGKIYQSLFGTHPQQEAIAAALGGRGTPEFRQFAQTMRVFQAASRTAAVGSQTATDLGKAGAAPSAGASAASAVLKNLNPLALLKNAGQAIEDASTGGAAARIAAGYLGQQPNAMAIEGLRVLSPTTYGLLNAAGAPAARTLLPGGVGLLGGPQPNTPPGPYLPSRR